MNNVAPRKRRKVRRVVVASSLAFVLVAGGGTA